MLYTDSTYLNAKKAKDGSIKLRPELELLRVFLREEYFAILLNADIYFEPVVTTLDPSLRLIIDNEIEKTNLPIYYLDRNKIRDKFLSICEDCNSNLTSGIVENKLSVNYVEFDEILYRESQDKVHYFDIIDSINKPTIVKMIHYFSEYIFFFENKEVLDIELKTNSRNLIKEKITVLIKNNGYDGIRLSEIDIRFDTIKSFERAGSEYNYLR